MGGGINQEIFWGEGGDFSKLTKEGGGERRRGGRQNLKMLRIISLEPNIWSLICSFILSYSP